jgi:MFS family permease
MNLDAAQAFERPAATHSVAGVLAGMMFFEWAIRGVWMPYLADYLGTPITSGGLGFSGGQVGWILGCGGTVGALAAPLIAGQLADRALDAERALALLILPGGLLIAALASVHHFALFLVLMAAYSITYMPTLSLTNSICFQNLADDHSFPRFRLCGTFGWIAASTLFPLLWLNNANSAVNTARIADALLVAGALSLLFGLYALFLLPKTPPKANPTHPWAFVRAFALLRNRGFLILVLSALPISMIHQAFYFRIAPYLRESLQLPLAWIGPVITVGQWCEMLCLYFLGFFLKRMGFKKVLILGAVSYSLRFAIFAVGHPLGLVIAAQGLHGIGAACFFAGAFICVERVTPADVRHSAQMVFGIAILGGGPILAAFYNQFFDRFTVPVNAALGALSPTRQAYMQFWTAQAAVALGAALLLFMAFPRIVTKADHDSERAA